MPARLSRSASQVTSEATWRCSECHTVQARAARCWRCSTPVRACQSCRSYRPSVAIGLGTCTDDQTGALISAADSRSCWGPATGPIRTMESNPSDGLFPESKLVPAAMEAEPAQLIRTTSAIRDMPDRAARANPSAYRSRPTKPDLETAGRAAWEPPDEDRLVEAPAVEPGKRLTTELQGRRRRWFR